MEQTLHRRILDTLRERYDTKVMNNVHRGEYVECLVQEALGDEWTLPWRDDSEDWADVDLRHRSRRASLEIKQSAAAQSWDLKERKDCRTRYPQFGIAKRRGWTLQGGCYRQDGIPTRAANIYIFAWHDKRIDQNPNHQDPNEWKFFVVKTSELPEDKKTIGLKWLRDRVSSCRVSSCRFGELKSVVEGLLG